MIIGGHIHLSARLWTLSRRCKRSAAEPPVIPHTLSHADRLKCFLFWVEKYCIWFLCAYLIYFWLRSGSYAGGCRGSIINNRDIETFCRYRTLKADALLIKSSATFGGPKGCSKSWPFGIVSRGFESTIRMSSDPIHKYITTRWGPPVISWFINPINYSYKYHKP